MNETIDYDEWHFGADARVSHYRLAKGDVIYHNGKYSTISSRPIDILLERQIILSNHHWAANRYIDVREMALAFLGYPVGKSGDRGDGASDIMQIYLETIRGLSKWQMALVDRICFEPMRHNDYAWAAHIKSNVRDAFDRLEIALHEAEHKQKELAKAPEV